MFPAERFFQKLDPPSLLSHTGVRACPLSGQDLLGVKLPRREKRAAINLHILWGPESEMREVGISSFQSKAFWPEVNFSFTRGAVATKGKNNGDNLNFDYWGKYWNNSE